MLLLGRPGEAVDFGETGDVRDQQQSEYEQQGADKFTACRQRVDLACDGRHFFIAQSVDARLGRGRFYSVFLQLSAGFLTLQISLEFLPR